MCLLQGESLLPKVNLNVLEVDIIPFEKHNRMHLSTWLHNSQSELHSGLLPCLSTAGCACM